MPESRFLDAAMFETSRKGGHKSWSEGRCLNWWALADPAHNEVMVEDLHSEVGVIADPSTSEMRAAASAKMTAKRIKYVEIDVCQNAASSLNEAAEMCGSSNIANGASRTPDSLHEGRNLEKSRIHRMSPDALVGSSPTRGVAHGRLQIRWGEP